MDSPRIVILGNSGAGKSTLARTLAAQSGAPVLDLDHIYWEPGQIAVARSPDAARADLAAFCAGPRWVIEGCYADLAATVLDREPLLILLHPGLQTCLDHCRARPFEPAKYASPAEQDARLDMLLQWVADYYHRDGPLSLQGHLALYRDYGGPKQLLTHVPGESTSG